MILSNNIGQKGSLGLCFIYGAEMLLGCFLAIFVGCAGIQNTNNAAIAEPKLKSADKAPGVSADDEIEQVRIRKYMLSAGDEINVTIFPQAELSRRLTIPPDGRFFYPLGGEIDVKGKSLDDLRKFILDGFSKYKKTTLMPGDEISILVYRHDELARRLIIPSDGRIFYPLIGTVELMGKSPEQVRETITDKFTKYLVDPQVTVDLVNSVVPQVVINPQVSAEVVAYGGQKVFVLGEVNNPGVFLTDGSMGVIEAILEAGGPTLDAKQNNVLLIKKRGDKPKPELITLNLEGILNGNDPDHDIVLQKGDIVYVPRTFISDVDRFFGHLSNIISPLLGIERGIFIGQQIEGNRGTEKATIPAQ
jgi:polysaccharide export outer membrane protein